jgi:dihydroorotate dehydrogenase (NAD+) catalytic subunit
MERLSKEDEVDISIELAGLELRTPLLLASGVAGLSISLMRKAVEAGAGAVVTKTVTYRPRKGFENPTLVKLGEHSYLNAMGLPNPGFMAVAKEFRGISLDAPIIASVAPSNEEETADMCSVMGEVFDAVELNLSCPHVKSLGLDIGSDPDFVRSIVKAAKHSTDVPIFTKISPNVTDIVSIGTSAVEAGTDCLVATNTLRAMAVDVEAAAPVLGNVIGGLSGQALHPVALRIVYELYSKLRGRTGIVGSGGVRDWTGAIEFMLVGASAVQIGSAIEEKGLEIFREICEGVRNYLRNKGYRKTSEIIGLAVRA